LHPPRHSLRRRHLSFPHALESATRTVQPSSSWAPCTPQRGACSSTSSVGQIKPRVPYAQLWCSATARTRRASGERPLARRVDHDTLTDLYRPALCLLPPPHLRRFGVPYEPWASAPPSSPPPMSARQEVTANPVRPPPLLPDLPEDPWRTSSPKTLRTARRRDLVPLPGAQYVTFSGTRCAAVTSALCPPPAPAPQPGTPEIALFGQLIPPPLVRRRGNSAGSSPRQMPAAGHPTIIVTNQCPLRLPDEETYEGIRVYRLPYCCVPGGPLKARLNTC